MRAWRDGGFTIHDISDPAKPKLLSHINWSPPFPGGTHTPLPLAGPQSGRRGRRSERRKMRQGHVPHVRRGCARAGEPGADLHAADAEGPGLLRASARSVRTTCTRTGRARSAARRRSSRPTTTPACACSTSGTRSRRRKSPPGCRPLPKKLIDPRPNVALAAKTCRCLRHARWTDVRQRLERRHARAAIRRLSLLRIVSRWPVRGLEEHCKPMLSRRRAGCRCRRRAARQRRLRCDDVITRLQANLNSVLLVQ